MVLNVRFVAFTSMLGIMLKIVSSLPSDGFRDCSDILKADPNAKSGFYKIMTVSGSNSTTVQVFCNMTGVTTSNGTGWMVFQRRQDGSVKFYRNWTEYAQGFGCLQQEFWLGNDLLSAITTSRRYVLRVDLGDWSGNYRYAEYDNFVVAGADNKYQLLSLGTYSGNAGDALSYQLGMKFTTYDQDNDAKIGVNCAQQYVSAWWHNACHRANLNGEYNNTAEAKGVTWAPWLDNYYSLRFTEMKIRIY